MCPCAALLPSRMMFLVNEFQALARYMGVNLRGGDVTVSEQHLHHTQVGTVVEQVRGKGVAQRVR